MATGQPVQEIITRLNTLDAYVASGCMPDPRDGQPDRNIAKMLVHMENDWQTLIDDFLLQTSSLNAVVDAKIKTAMAMAGKTKQTDERFRFVLESKPLQDIGSVVDAKRYRQWSKHMKHSVEQVRPSSR